MNTEEWRPVVGYEEFYAVSNQGRVMRTKGANHTRVGLILKHGLNAFGYPQVGLCAFGKSKTHRVHRLVAAAFFGAMPSDTPVNHKNGIKTDNRVENLEYVTPSENTLHSYRIGLQKPLRGEKHGSAILTQSQVDEIRALAKSGDYNQSQIAFFFGVARTTVGDIVTGKRWNGGVK